jgi:hypothetical protein
MDIVGRIEVEEMRVRAGMHACMRELTKDGVIALSCAVLCCAVLSCAELCFVAVQRLCI